MPTGRCLALHQHSSVWARWPSSVVVASTTASTAMVKVQAKRTVVRGVFRVLFHLVEFLFNRPLRCLC